MALEIKGLKRVFKLKKGTTCLYWTTRIPTSPRSK